MIFVKFKPAYAVTLGNEEIGYINNRTELQEVMTTLHLLQLTT